ncbi:MAG TPA: phage tail tube protein [Jatrophihabitantaceae bacterium]|jgi:hypothetical protein
MPTTNYYPSNLQWVGAAKEVTYGTAISAPTFWIPVDSPKWSPKINPLTDQATRGLMGMDYQQVAGMRYDELTYKTYMYMDSVYQHLIATFGGPDTITGSSDPWTHKTSLYNGSGTNGAQPPSYTLFYTDAAGKSWQMPGCMIVTNKLDVKVDELDTMEITWNGMPATPITIPTNTPTTAKPMPAWNSIITIGGAATSAFSEVSLEYKRDTKALNTMNNTQSPLAIYSGAFSVAGSLTAVYQGSTDVNLVDYLTNVQPPLTVKLAPVGDAVHSLTLQHSVVAYDDASPQGSGDWMEVSATVKALMNATDALDSKQSPGQVVFLNAAATAF